MDLGWRCSQCPSYWPHGAQYPCLVFGPTSRLTSPPIRCCVLAKVATWAQRALWGVQGAYHMGVPATHGQRPGRGVIAVSGADEGRGAEPKGVRWSEGPGATAAGVGDGTRRCSRAHRIPRRTA